MKNRLIITGSAGSGKSSLLKGMSSTNPMVSNIYENAPHLAPKNAEPVMIDCGEFVLEEGRKIELYATPGQRRFQFMWKTLSKRAVGMILVVDHRRPNPLSDILMYLENFQELISSGSMVIGLNYFTSQGGPDWEEYQTLLQNMGLNIPVVPIVANQEEDAKYCLETLLMRLCL